MIKFLLTTFIFLIFCQLTAFADSWKHLPLNVYIAPHPDKMYVKNAFSSWERWTGRSLFKFTDSDTPQPDIKVTFANDLNSDSAIGITYTKSIPAEQRIAHAHIVIRLKKTDNIKRHNGRETYLITAHEIGHALGLKHTDNPMDLMYPSYRDITRPSNNDLKSFYELYGK